MRSHEAITTGGTTTTGGDRRFLSATATPSPGPPQTAEDRPASARPGAPLAEAPARGSEQAPDPCGRDPWKDIALRRLIAIADVTAVLSSAALVGATADNGLASALWWVGLLPLWILVGKLHGLYDADHVRLSHLTSDELPNLFRWATVSTAVATAILALGPAALSLAAALAGWGTALCTVLVLRAGARGLWRRTLPAERGVVVGEGELASALARKLVLEPGHHLSLVESLVPERAGANGRSHEPLPGLADALERAAADRVILAVPDLDEAMLAQVVGTCRRLGVKLSVAPPLRAMLGTAVTLNHLAELPLIEFRTWESSDSTTFLKRSMDVVLAGTGLVALAPLLLTIGVLVRLDSPGPALFRQRRAGLGGEPFRLYKFRTMVRDAEARLDDLIDVEELTEPMFKLHPDPRVTRVGRLLRRTSLDELPQLINVLRGEMSLVGPRPEELRLVARYPPELRFRLEVRPGVTGPMQIHGRGDLTLQERMAVEREYIENYSLGKDVAILIATGRAVFRRRGAY